VPPLTNIVLFPRSPSVATCCGNEGIGCEEQIA
jgi:hypothetical protein